MTQESCNCIVCAREFNVEELQSVALSKINITPFKVCQNCFESSDPAEDYREVKTIVSSYLRVSEAKVLFGEVMDILASRKDNKE